VLSRRKFEAWPTAPVKSAPPALLQALTMNKPQTSTEHKLTINLLHKGTRVKYTDIDDKTADKWIVLVKNAILKMVETDELNVERVLDLNNGTLHKKYFILDYGKYDDENGLEVEVEELIPVKLNVYEDKILRDRDCCYSGNEMEALEDELRDELNPIYDRNDDEEEEEEEPSMWDIVAHNATFYVTSLGSELNVKTRISPPRYGVNHWGFVEYELVETDPEPVCT
jgi:hypothetical protein